MWALALACGTGLTHADDISDATALMQQGQHAQALEQVATALAQRPNDPRLLFLKGLIFRQQNRIDDAVAEFTALTQAHPELPEPYNNLAVLHASQGQLDKARDALESALRAHPQYASAQENLGDVYVMLASQAYARARQIETGNAALASKQSALSTVLKASPGLNR